MASKDKLRGSFGSLSDTLAYRFDPGFPPDIAARWLGVMGLAAAIAHRTDAWNALPDPSPGFDPVIAGLDDATHTIVVAGTAVARMAALDQADAALAGLGTLLDAA